MQRATLSCVPLRVWATAVGWLQPLELFQFKPTVSSYRRYRYQEDGVRQVSHSGKGEGAERPAGREVGSTGESFFSARPDTRTRGLRRRPLCC